MNWSERACTAALELSTGEERQDDSTTAQLIRDIVAVFTANGEENLKTADLLAHLYEIEESPWGEWHGRPLSAHGLSRLLRPYRIKTMSVKVDGETVRGYKAEQFADAFARSSVTGVTGVTSQARSHAGGNASNARNASGGEQEEDHPGDTLEAALLAAFPAAALVTDDGPPWTTVIEGRFGSLQIRDVPLDDSRTQGEA